MPPTDSGLLCGACLGYLPTAAASDPPLFRQGHSRSDRLIHGDRFDRILQDKTRAKNLEVSGLQKEGQGIWRIANSPRRGSHPTGIPTAPGRTVQEDIEWLEGKHSYQDQPPTPKAESEEEPWWETTEDNER